MKKEISKILIDLAKLIFGGVILAGVMRQDISPVILFVGGGSVTLITMSSGLFLKWLDDRQENKKLIQENKKPPIPPSRTRKTKRVLTPKKK